MGFEHIPVLLEECIEGLAIKPDGIYVDCTLGGAGHSLEIAKRLSPEGRLIGIDRDEEALRAASDRLAGYKNVVYVHDNFANIKTVAQEQNLYASGVDGFLLDIGVSSHQLDEADRGFSYNYDAPLDMRMDRRNPLSAHTVVNTYSAERLTKIIADYGEERWAKRISDFIVAERQKKPIDTTFELVSVIKKAVPKGARSDGPHPAKRTFQAIRIEVNGELEILGSSLREMTELLKPGGRLCIITFHSLEDRIVKNVFRELENPCTCPRDFPVCVCGKKPSVKIITRRPVTAGSAELALNHRSHSAKLRIAEKIN